MSKKANRQKRRNINLVPLIGLLLGVTGVLLAIYGQNQLYGSVSSNNLVKDFYANAGAELISIGITVFIIDNLYRLRERRREKARLIRELGSGDRGTALRAVQELKAEKWFYDGTLVGAELWRADLSLGQLWSANLESADLRAVNFRESELKGANLRNARLNHSDLRGTELSDANLTGASLKGVQLQGSNISLGQIMSAKTLEGATMPDGSPYKIWKNRPLPVTLAERQVELDAILTAKELTTTTTENANNSQRTFLFSLGAATGILGYILVTKIQKTINQ